MKVELRRHTPIPTAICGEAAALCTASSDWEKSLRGAMQGGHESVLEHATFTFLIEDVSRVLLAQITRHRIASFSVQSQRYVGMGEMPCVTPPTFDDDPEVLEEYEKVLEHIRWFYEYAVDRGIPKEDARYATPQAAQTCMIVTMNARELLHFFSLRCCNRAQWEIRNLADEMLFLCRQVAPELFKKAGCACMRGEKCPEGKMTCGKPRERCG